LRSRRGSGWTVEAGYVAKQLGAGEAAAASYVDGVQLTVLDQCEQRRAADVEGSRRLLRGEQ
jgi:hypothetical protein